MLASLFPEQAASVSDPSRFKVVWTTRRAGKTTAVLADFLADALLHPRSRYAYVALTRQSAEDISWPILFELDRRHSIGLKPQEAKLRMRVPGGSLLSLYGADRPGWMQRLYGQKLRGAAIDEAAFFSVDLQALVADILRPGLTDLAGVLYLMSIPGILPRGLFYELTRNLPSAETFSGRTPQATPACPDAPRWSVHSWTTEANPYMRVQFAAEIEGAKRVNPDIERAPSFQRNYRKAWVQSLGERVYAWDEALNTYPGAWTARPDDHYVIGIDFGWTDQQAVSLNVWRDDYPQLVELDSQALSRERLGDLAARVKGYMADYPVRPPGTFQLVGDPGHRQLFEEFVRTFSLPIMPAEKTKKQDAILVVNSMYQAGQILICSPERSQHVDEMRGLVWRTRLDGTRIEERGQPNNCCDAHLMAARHARHYLIGEQEPQVLTEQEIRARERRVLRDAEIARLQASREPRWNDL